MRYKLEGKESEVQTLYEGGKSSTQIARMFGCTYPSVLQLLLQCKRGHEMLGNTLYITPKGVRGCRACRSIHEEKLKAQGNRCAICQRVLSKPHLDHDHTTNQLRDALCNKL